MIRLYFTINRETFRIEIKEKEIHYCDRIFTKMVRLVPKDDEFIKKVLLSRNKIPARLSEYFNLTEKEQIEYDNAKDEEELADICIRDVRMKGGILIKREDV